MRILVFGDSIAQGFFDSRGGWVQRLASDLHSRTLASKNTEGNFNVRVYNLGVSGDGVERLTERIESEANFRMLDSEVDLVVMSIGINDSILRDNMTIQDVYEFQEDLESLANTAKDLTDNLLFVGLSAVDEAISDPFPDGRQYKNNRINLFEDTIKQVAIVKDIKFVPVHDKFLQELNNGHELLSDGLHPNDLGHELIYQIVKPEIEEFIND